MGYRHYIGFIDKEKLEELRNKVYVDTYYEDGELDETKEWLQFDEIRDNCFYYYNLGKLYFDETNETYDELYKEKEDIIKDEDIEMFICPQNIFLTLANVYLNKTKRYFEELIKPFKENEDFEAYKKLNKEQFISLKKMINKIEDKIFYFNRKKFCENKKDIEIDDLYEHSAFNLAHIHKMIDFEKQVVICFAW